MKNLIVALVAIFAASNANARPLEEYVEKTTQFGRITRTADGGATMQAELPFRHTRYFTDYRQVCDTVQCGWDDIRICERRRECNGIPGPGQVCREYDDCRIEQRPRYCEVNCRMEPFTNSTVDIHTSQCVAKFRTVDGSPVDTGKIKDFFLNTKTNSRFVEHVLRRELRDRTWGYQLDNMDPNDKTLIVLKSDKYNLAIGQDFLRLNPDFRAGDAIVLDVVLAPNTNRQKFSAEGVPYDLPALHTSGWGPRQ